jgi:hypothetical protein
VDLPRVAIYGTPPASGSRGLEGDDGAVEGLGEFDADAWEHAGALEGVHCQVQIGSGKGGSLLKTGVLH